MSTKEITRKRFARGAALFGCAAVLTLACAAAAARSASTVPIRIVTVSLNGSGKATWSISGSSAEKADQTLTYSWHGTVRFRVPVKALNDPAHAKFSTVAGTTLRANWSGQLTGTKYSQPYTGPEKCDYKGTNVAAPVQAQLTNAKAPGSLWIVFHPIGENFFKSKGPGATVSCVSPVGANGPPHFEPEWLFRDTILDHYQFSSNTGIVVVPSKLLPKGAVTVAFPLEIGKRDSISGNLRWNNRGRTVVKAS